MTFYKEQILNLSAERHLRKINASLFKTQRTLEEERKCGQARLRMERGTDDKASLRKILASISSADGYANVSENIRATASRTACRADNPTATWAQGAVIILVREGEGGC